MIQLPKEISKIIKTIEAAGFEAYAVGGCVRDSLLGKRPEDWDLASSAPLDKLRELFPQAEIISEKFGVVKISEGEITADIAAFRIDGEYTDFRRPESVTFTNGIEEDLKRRDFTMNAIAVNPERGVVDPYNGRADIKEKRIKIIGDPDIRFEEDPLRILRGIRFAAQLDFEVDKATLQAMKEKASLLENISVDRIRDEFIKIITAKNSGKGFGLCIETGALVPILGEECTKNATKSELNMLRILAENIDKSKFDEGYRVALVYLCFEKNKAMKAIEKMNYTVEMKKMLKNAVTLLEDLSFIKTTIDLKVFISRIDMELYEYLENLSKQQRKVFDLGEFKIQSRIALFDTIKSGREPIFVEDLAVNGDDLKELGIQEGVEIGKMLKMLLDVVHKNPFANDKTYLLRKVKEFRRNPISALLRGVRWYK